MGKDKDGEFVIATIPDVTPEEWFEGIEASMAERGWTVIVRYVRYGEAPGTYLKTRHGLQILGYSIPIPDDFSLDLVEAYNRQIDGKTGSGELHPSQKTGL